MNQNILGAIKYTKTNNMEELTEGNKTKKFIEVIFTLSNKFKK